MTCINKNTVFYKTLIKNNYDSKDIAKIDLALESENFKQWYGNGERDSFSNPSIIKEVYLINDKGEQITLNDLLNDQVYEKRKFYKKDLTYLDKVNTFLKEARIGIEKRISAFHGTDYAERLENLLEQLDKLDKNDYVNALTTHSQYILKTVEDFENRFIWFDKINKSKLDKKEIEENNKNFKNFLVQSSNFLQTFSKIDALESPKIENLEVSKVIKTLKDIENRVTELQNRVNSEVESETRKTLEHLITNPEIRSGVMDFLASQFDESKVQMMMDALGDSHVPFLAGVDKFYKLNMAEKNEEKKQMQRDWREFTKGFNGNFDKFLNRILETRDGKRTGRFIQEFQEEVYNQLYDYNSRLSNIQKAKGKESQEYIDLLDEYFKWRRNNIEQKYTDQYYKTLDLLTPEARAIKQELDEKRSAILSKGNENLSIDDWEDLKDIENEMKWLKSSINKDQSPKTGEDLKIAKSIFKYSHEMSKFYHTTGVAQKSFDKTRTEAEEKGGDYLEQWDYHNTSEQFSDRFWELFNDLVKQYPKTEEIESIREDTKQLLLPFKNEKGEVKVQDLTDEVRLKLEELKSKLSLLKGELSKSMDAKHKKDLANKFKNLVEFIPSSEYLKTFKDKQDQLEKGTITKEEYNKWFEDNHDSDVYTEEINPRSIWTTMKPRNKKFIESKPNNLWKVTDIKPEFHNPNYREDNNGKPIPKQKWINQEYDNISEEDKKGLEHIQDTLNYLVEHSKSNIIKQGYIPAISKDARSIVDKVLGKELAKEEQDSLKAVTESGEIVKFLPFKYIKKLNQIDLKQEKYQVKEGMTNEEIKDIEKLRKEAIKINKESHGDILNYNLEETMEHFIEASLTNKYKSKMEVDVKLFKEQLKHLNIKELDSKGNQIYDKIISKVRGEKTEHEKNAIGSNTEKHFNEWLEAVFYEDFNLDEGKLTDYASKIQNFTSLRAMGFNVLSGLNNVIVGNLNERIEGAGGRYYSHSDFRSARKLYFANITNFIADAKHKESSNFLTAFIKDMDILISEDELSNNPDGLIATAIHKLRMVRDAAYFMQHIGEHQIQNATLIAMANSHRIIDGKIMSFNEFWENKKFKIDDKMPIEEAFKAMDNNVILKKTLVEEFENHTKFIDAFELKNGYSVLKKDSGVNLKDVHEFRERVIGINQKLHGIYNEEDAGMIQRYALGRLAIQFRKWMRPGWNKRFGAKFGKKIYNERVRDYEEGMYVTTAKYLGSPFVKNWKEHRQAQEGIAYAAYKTLSDSFKNLIFDSKIRWHMMDEIEKANVRRTAVEMTFLIAITALGFMAKHMKGDAGDDDKLKNKMITFALYQADRLFGELSNFTPIGIVREGNRLFKAPSPVFNTFEDVAKLGGAIFLYPFRNEEERKFKGGTYSGQDRVKVYGQDLIPFYNQFVRIQNMNANTQKYGIFR